MFLNWNDSAWDNTMSLLLSQVGWWLSLSLSKSGHGMVHLLLIVNPSPSLQFLRDLGLVSHTLSRCCLNNKTFRPRLESWQYLPDDHKHLLTWKEINVSRNFALSLLDTDRAGKAVERTIRKSENVTRHNNEHGNGYNDLQWKMKQKVWNYKLSAEFSIIRKSVFV